MGSHLEPAVREVQTTRIEGTLIELRDITAALADKMVMMIFGQFPARPVTKIQPPNKPKPRQQIQRPVHGNHPHPRTPGPDLLHTLMLLRRYRPHYRLPLRRSLETSAPQLAYYRPNVHRTPCN